MKLFIHIFYEDLTAITFSSLHWESRKRNEQSTNTSYFPPLLRHLQNIYRKFASSNTSRLEAHCLFVTEEIQYHGGIRSRELGQAPILLCVPTS